MADNKKELVQQRTFVIDNGADNQITGEIDTEQRQEMVNGFNSAFISTQSNIQIAAVNAAKEAATISVLDSVKNTLKATQDTFTEAAKTAQLVIKSLQPSADSMRLIIEPCSQTIDWEDNLKAAQKKYAWFAELRESGMFKRMCDVANKISDMGIQISGQSFQSIQESIEAGDNNGEKIIDLLPLFAQQMSMLNARPGCEWTSIYDLLRCYSGGEATPEQSTAVQNAKAQLAKKLIKQKVLKRAKQAYKDAENTGAIMTLGGRLGSFSQENFWDVFTSNIISTLPEGMRENSMFDNGKLNMLALNGKPLQQVKSINGAALMAICKAVFDTDMREYGDGNFTIALYLPAICKELGIDPRSITDNRRGKNSFKNTQREKAFSEAGTVLTWSEQRIATMEKLLKPFDPDVARTTDGSYYRLCVIEQYDAEKELLYVSSPFFFKLREIIALQADRHSALTTLFHADVANQRNWAAVELANRILAGIVRRGITRPDSKTFKNNGSAVSRRTVTKTASDGTKTIITERFQPVQQQTEEPIKEKVFTWTDSFKSLINDCPQLQHELAEIEHHAAEDENGKKYHKTQAYNAKLKQTFTAAYRIILEKTDAPKYYKGLRIEPTNAKGEIITPTKSTLRSCITIRHNGKNKCYCE